MGFDHPINEKDLHSWIKYVKVGVRWRARAHRSSVCVIVDVFQDRIAIQNKTGTKTLSYYQLVAAYRPVGVENAPVREDR